MTALHRTESALPTVPAASALRVARRRDRRVYTRSHPVLFGLLAATRRRPVTRVGGAVLVHDAEPYRQALTHVPLDRTAAGTTGGAARELSAGGALFDQEGAGHRGARRAVAEALGAAGVERLRPVWREALSRGLAPLAEGHTVDLVVLARELAGTTVRALLGTQAGPQDIAEAAARAAATAVRDHLPGPRPPGTARAAAAAAARLEALLAADKAADETDSALRAVLAVAAVNTTVAALPRAAAWCADAGLWDQAGDERLRPALVGELLRVIAPSPLLPRVAAADADLGGCPVRAGDRLILVARHAARAHSNPPDAHHPAPPAEAQLVFGAGPHACPGARLARAQLADTLAALAPHRPTVVRARADRAAALPSWHTLTVRASREGAPAGAGRGAVAWTDDGASAGTGRGAAAGADEGASAGTGDGVSVRAGRGATARIDEGASAQAGHRAAARTGEGASAGTGDHASAETGGGAAAPPGAGAPAGEERRAIAGTGDGASVETGGAATGRPGEGASAGFGRAAVAGTGDGSSAEAGDGASSGAAAEAGRTAAAGAREGVAAGRGRGAAAKIGEGASARDGRGAVAVTGDAASAETGGEAGAPPGEGTAAGAVRGAVAGAGDWAFAAGHCSGLGECR